MTTRFSHRLTTLLVMVSLLGFSLQAFAQSGPVSAPTSAPTPPEKQATSASETTQAGGESEPASAVGDTETVHLTGSTPPVSEKTNSTDDNDSAENTSLNETVKRFVDTLRSQAEEGDAKAQTQLGLLYHYGRGVKNDFSEAARWFNLAAQQNDPVAQNILGHYYQGGVGGLKEDYLMARKLYEQSADQGNMVAEYQLGMLYFRGLGVPVNYEKSAYWSERSANRGYLKAQNNIAYLYLKGMGVKQDFIEAYKWYYLASLQGNSISAMMRNQLAKALSQVDLLEAQWRIDDYREAFEAAQKEAKAQTEK